MLPARLRAAMARHGSRPAVVRAGAPPLTYRDLATAVDAEAERLTAGGVRQGDRVLYCGERGLEHVVTLLASWDVGAAVSFARPDSRHRLERISRLVAPRAVVGNPAGVAGVDLVGQEPPPLDLAAPRPVRRADHAELDLAYLVPTSGTTGTPKVVAVGHGALARRWGWAARTYPLAADDVVLGSGAPAFDISLWEVTAPLAAGATLAVAPVGAEFEPVALASFLREHGVTVAHFVPSLLAHFLRGGGGPALAGLRLLLLGGERLAGALCRETRTFTGARIWNQYGPAETCIDVLAHEVTDADLAMADVPIGTAVDGVRAAVSGPGDVPVVDGGTGLLSVGGPLLAWGYLGMPGSTARVFVPDPHGPPGSRCYSTGDLVRRDGDSLCYAGRIDDQVKIRGVRLEPAEVESVIGAHPGVGEVAVVAVTTSGEVHLVAHVIPRDSWSESDVRQHVAETLSLSAMPVAFVLRATFPRLNAGKVDRSALAAEGLPRRADEEQPQVRSETEKLVQEVWSDVLKVRVGPASSFFESGGNSLLAMQAVARMRHATGSRLPVRLLFTSSTLEEYAAAVDVHLGRP